jgi:hypothetical protein
MELDINSQWVSYFNYDQAYPTNPDVGVGHKLLPDMQRGEDRANATSSPCSPGDAR